MESVSIWFNEREVNALKSLLTNAVLPEELCSTRKEMLGKMERAEKILRVQGRR